MQKKYQEEIEFTLLENGLDFIWSALEHLSGNSGKRELKYAVLHLCSGIELVLKERLQREHWSLIFEKLDNANRKDYEAGKFTSVTFNSCLKRLTDICGSNISGKQRQELLSFRDKRNRMEHFNIVDSADAITAAASGVLNFLVDFINAELHPENFDENEAATLDDIRQRLSEFEIFVAKRWDVIRKDVENAMTAVATCSSCKQDAVIFEDGARCLFCGYGQLGEEAAHDYISNVLGANYHSVISGGGEWPLYWCPECVQETLVDRGSSGSQYPHEQFICFNCGAAWMEGSLGFCGSCGQLYDPKENDFGMCDDCFNAIVNKD